MRKLYFMLIFISGLANAQIGDLFWSSERKLQLDDYQVKSDSRIIYSNIHLGMQIKGFDVMNKNFNKNITNTLQRDASLINLNTPNIENYLEFEQMRFDLAEIYARLLRKEMLVNRKKLIYNLNYANELLSSKSAEMNREILKMEDETVFGENTEKTKEWKADIKNRLLELEDFRSENISKINLKN